MRRMSVMSVGVAAALTLGACSAAAGTGASPPTSVGAATPQANSSGGAGQGGRLGGMPGVSGLVADVTGSTAQVQTPSSQTAVSWTGSTRFSQQRATTPNAVKVGDCVIALATVRNGSGGSRPTTSPASPAAQPSSFTATSVEILPTMPGGCSRGASGRAARGAGGSGATSQPGGTSTPRPSLTGRAGNGARLGATGKVTALGSSSFTVRSVRGFGGATPQGVTVAWTGTTRFTTLTSASASAVRVGVCLSAVGKMGDTGAVTATTITLSPPVNGSCVRTGTFGRGRAGTSATTAASLNG